MNANLPALRVATARQNLSPLVLSILLTAAGASYGPPWIAVIGLVITALSLACIVTDYRIGANRAA